MRVSWLRLVLAILASYRLARMISKEEGPHLPLPMAEYQMGFFSWLRMIAGAYDYGPDKRPETNLGRGMDCPLCTGVYTSAFCLVLALFPSKLGDTFLGWLGISGAQVFLYQLSKDEED